MKTSLIAAILLFTATLAGQDSTGSIQGATLRSGDNRPVAGARVTARNLAAETGREIVHVGRCD